MAARVAASSRGRGGGEGKPLLPPEDLRYYSRGLFNNVMITKLDGLRGKVRCDGGVELQ